MSIKKIAQIADQLQSGALTLDLNVAQKFEKALGDRYSVQEQAALLAISKGIEDGSVKTTGIAATHAFLDVATQKTESRFANAIQKAGSWSKQASAFTAALGGGSVAVSMALAGATLTAAALPAIGIGAFAGLAGGQLLAGTAGFIDGLLED